MITYAVQQNVAQCPKRVRFGKGIRALSTAMLVTGVMVPVLEYAFLGVSVTYLGGDAFTPVPAGLYLSPIWSGGFLIATAAIGIGAVQSGNKCLLITSLILSILASVTAVVAFSMSIVWAAVTQQNCYYYGYDYDCDYDDDRRMVMMKLTTTAAIVKHSLIVAWTFVYMVMAIISASLMCGNLCGCCCAKEQTPQLVQLIVTAPLQYLSPPAYEATAEALQEKEQLPC